MRIKNIILMLCMVLSLSKAVWAEENFQRETILVNSKRVALNHYKTGHSKVIIIAHGFYNNKDTLLFREISDVFTKDFDVITFDFRGHGKSQGLFTWTSREPEDLHAVIDYAKRFGYEKIGVMGFSLGAAVSLIEGSTDRDIDSIIAVSAPYSFWRINFHFWEKEMLNDLKLNLGPKGKGKGIRPGNPFLHKIRPMDIVDKVSPTPVLFLHGDHDWLIKHKHSQRLFAKAGEPKELVIIKGAGHAEKIFDSHMAEFEEVCMKWFMKTLQ